ncbi:uncharacterized protein LOC121867318 [Homarus americanus]|uniref:Uncharacterized protein n=1 Tax=Homarus americanus TaxID=6706 RepID=A0A8J5K6M9_HOMAM|nr:uncharacterized protein LOC121867318 [Homarus americanus]XP_042223163.1 uncharacterized protein LOC121867318 [Homarus americanus]XP_042223164.1 uncharacterized protein LOC121867318 [Homarus americanus]KAG7168554.1 hypothetical protein Hamer_G002640 [Homarus americanus]
MTEPAREMEVLEEPVTWAHILPRVLTFLTTFLSSDADKSSLSKEAVELASKFFSLGADTQATFGLTSSWIDLITGGGSWVITFLTVPILLAFVIWYFITTFVIKKNVLGRSVWSSSEVNKQDEVFDKLSRQVVEAIDNPW